MEILKQRILKDGKVKEGNVLKVDSFLNHQMDIRLLDEIGREFRRRFAGEEINKILTIEASGIGIAVAAAPHFDYAPVVFAKKSKSKNLDGELYTSQVTSFTRGTTFDVQVSKKYLNPGDRVLIIAHGKVAAQGTPEELAAQLAARGMIAATALGTKEQILAGRNRSRLRHCHRKRLPGRRTDAAGEGNPPGVAGNHRPV